MTRSVPIKYDESTGTATGMRGRPFKPPGPARRGNATKSTKAVSKPAAVGTPGGAVRKKTASPNVGLSRTASITVISSQQTEDDESDTTFERPQETPRIPRVNTESITANGVDERNDEDDDDDDEGDLPLEPRLHPPVAGKAASPPIPTLSQEPTSPTIPAPLLTRLLHESFADKSMKITKDANQVMGRYIEIYIREALARAAMMKKAESTDASGAGVGEGWLEVEDLEKLAPGLVMDF
ncbi:hypothetical protein LTR28_011491 [Elasticomyces elasticus]|nr:hypothetical protein LTR28_011491 [Elasticomyces elasticus]